MHSYLKVFILIIFLWTLMLLWTFSYLSIDAPLPGTGVRGFIEPIFRSYHKHEEKIVIGVVACGEKLVTDITVLLKSILVSGAFYGIRSIDLILFADDEHLYELDMKVQTLQRSTNAFKFRYEIHPVIFPAKNHDEWRQLFKPCASQRLFLHAALPHINELLYLDVDTLVVGDLREIWSRFRQMSGEQAVGLVPEHEVESIGWYNRFAQHPIYPPMGLNTGVMLMNLTRLRDAKLNWETLLLQSYKEYKDKLVFGDQDLINIVFHRRPDAVYVLPCSYNYRTDHCMYGLNCKDVEYPEGKSIQILHGSRDVFHNRKTNAKMNRHPSPLFRKVYKYYEKFNMSSGDFIRDIVRPFKKEVEMDAISRSKNKTNQFTPNCDNIGKFFFNLQN